jgi:RNA polymerase sigma-70 factor (ECF subfamily)
MGLEQIPPERADLRRELAGAIERHTPRMYPVMRSRCCASDGSSVAGFTERDYQLRWAHGSDATSRRPPCSAPAVPAIAACWEEGVGSRTIAPRMALARAGDRPAPDAAISTAGDAAAALSPGAAAAAADPDVALMLRVQAGDETAFQELFRKFSPRVLAYIRRFVRTEARAEEVAQDVFVQIYRFRDRYHPESRLSAWVYKIATNHCLNELRRPERRLRVDIWARRNKDGEEIEPQLADPKAASPEQMASSHELARLLDAAVAKLPPKQRAALLLSRVDGLAYKDVAEAMGCTEGAVKALIFRAIHTLKPQLKDFVEEEEE